MRECMFPIGTNLKQEDCALFLKQWSGNQAACVVGVGDVGNSDKEKSWREQALTSTANSKSLPASNNT